MAYRVFAIVLVLGGSAPAADLAGLQGLLEQAGAAGQTDDAIRMAAYEAKRELFRQFAEIDDALRDTFALWLVRALSDPRPEMRIAAAQTLVIKPREQDAGRLLAHFQTESNPAARRVFVRCVIRSISKLPEPARGTAAAAAVVVFEDMIRAPTTKPELRRMLAVSLGDLGPTALPAIRALRSDAPWASILHSVFPVALAGTGDPAACGDVVALYESDASVGFRVGCIHAIGALLRRSDAGGRPAVQPAIDLLRAAILQSPDPRLAAAAAVAYSRWPGASSDGEIIGAIQDGLQDSSGDERKGYLRALLALDLPLGPEMRAFLQAIRDSQTAPATHRKIATALLTEQTNGQ